MSSKHETINRKIQVYSDCKNSQVDMASCNFQVGLNGYCNHVVSSLLKVADYSLNFFRVVLPVMSCTR